MKQYPIKVPRKNYSGSKPNLIAKRNDYNRIAIELELAVNKMIEESPRNSLTITYSDVSDKTGYEIELIRDVLYGVDCGSNGLTVYKNNEVELP